MPMSILAATLLGAALLQAEPPSDGAAVNVDEIVFAVREAGADGHWYANFSYYAADENRKCYRAGGRLCKLNVDTGEMTTLVDDPGGSIRDPEVHYDGRRILFSWRKEGSDSFHLHEINADGTGLRQLTDGSYDDIEPCYLPDGDIVFVSSRCRRWVNCWLTQVAVLYRCDADGGNIRRISANIEHDNTPAVLHDGRLLYTRWEYIDRSQVHYHHLWTANPDGTAQMVYFGNQHPGKLYIDARPIPGSEDVLLIDSPGHGRNEHRGNVAVLSPKGGPDRQAMLRHVARGGQFRDPYPLAADAFLVAKGRELLLMDDTGKTTTLFALPETFSGELHEPRPLQARPRPRLIPPREDWRQPTGRLVLADIYHGRNMAGIARGEIKKLLVLESLPKPINYTGGMEPLSYGGTFTLERILGTVPVEEDGSAYMELPASRPLFFVALDAHERSVKRMQSFLTVMPGETTGCVGCHEQRTTAPPASQGTLLAAMRRPPSRLTPVQDIPEVFDFPRDIQPILDRHCVACHGYEKRGEHGPFAGSVILTGDRGPMYSHSYYTLSARRQMADGRNRPQSNYAPRAIGDSASPLVEKLLGGHHGVKAAPHEQRMVRYWVNSGAPYPGTYAALGTGMIGGYEQNQIDRSDLQWPEVKAAKEVLNRHCATCHTGPTTLPDSPTGHQQLPPWAIRYGDLRLRLSRHILYNLSRPEKSLQILAPLAKEAGGLGICRNADDRAVWQSTDEPDYQTLLAAIRRTKAELDRIKRFDMPDFRPRDAYVREMIRYGVLPEGTDPTRQPIDVYATDRAYWDLFDHDGQ